MTWDPFDMLCFMHVDNQTDRMYVQQLSFEAALPNVGKNEFQLIGMKD